MLRKEAAYYTGGDEGKSLSESIYDGIYVKRLNVLIERIEVLKGARNVL